jgi:hypothetical protein
VITDKRFNASRWSAETDESGPAVASGKEPEWQSEACHRSSEMGRLRTERSQSTEGGKRTYAVEYRTAAVDPIRSSTIQ